MNTDSLSTSWIGEIMAEETSVDPPVEKATQAGGLAILFYSGKLRRLAKADLSSSLRYLSCFETFGLPRSHYTAFWIRRVWQAAIAISLLGVSWACAVWVPPFLRELETRKRSLGDLMALHVHLGYITSAWPGKSAIPSTSYQRAYGADSNTFANG